MFTKISLILMVAIFSVFSISGCSSLLESTRKSVSGDSSTRKIKKDVKWVSKVQYDELMAKHKNLSDKYENLKDETSKNSKSFSQASELVNTEIVGDETIDLFNKDTKSISIKKTGASDEKFEKDLEYYRKAQALKTNNKIDEALKVFQFLENSGSRQIQVRAKNQIAEIYFSKKKYDLALQVFEGIIHGHSFSGIVIDALKGAVKSSSKLGLKEKKAKYTSILQDFFEVRA